MSLCTVPFLFFFFNNTATTEIYTLSLHDALPISATPYHRVFAWAQGRDAIFIKLRPEWYKEALADGGRLDASYPAGWVEFIAGGGRMPPARQAQWFAVISHWIQAGYDDCVQGTAAAGKTETMPEP